jgi:hypothetical protein
MFSQTSTSMWCTGLFDGAQDSVRCRGWPGDELDALGKKRRRRGNNSPDCLVCTGLYGEPTAPTANNCLRDQWATRGRANGRMVTPDCPVCTGQCPMCTGQCPVRQRDQRPNGRLRQKRKEIMHRTVRGTTRQKARIVFQLDLQRLLAALGL